MPIAATMLQGVELNFVERRWCNRNQLSGSNAASAEPERER